MPPPPPRASAGPPWRPPASCRSPATSRSFPVSCAGPSGGAQRLGDNFLEPVFFANSIAPAVAIALAAIVALARAERGEGRGYLALAAVLAVGAGFFKVFTGAQLVLALGLAWLLGRGRRRLLVVLVPAALALVALALSSRAPAGVAGVSVALVPFAAAGPALTAFGFPALRGVGYVLAGLAWLVLSLGLRVVGVPRAWRALREGGGATCALAALALCGWPLAMLLRITADPGFDESSLLPAGERRLPVAVRRAGARDAGAALAARGRGAGRRPRAPGHAWSSWRARRPSPASRSRRPRSRPWPRCGRRAVRATS